MTHSTFVGQRYTTKDSRKIEVTIHEITRDNTYHVIHFHRDGEALGKRTLSISMFFGIYEAVETKKTAYNKYDRTVIGKDGNTCVTDVYRVLDAFDVTNPMLQHLAKKALCAGLRGHKGLMEDLKDIQKSIEEAILFEEQKEQHNA